MDINDFTLSQLKELQEQAFDLYSSNSSTVFLRQKTGISLPDWVVARLPEDEPRSEIGFDSRRFVDLMTGRKSHSVSELYDELVDEGRMVQFHDSIKDHVEGYMPGFMVFCDSDGESSRGLLHHSQKSDSIFQGYFDFIVSWREWKDNPNPATAWDFLDRHPAFWTTSDVHVWNTDGGMELSHVGYFIRQETGEMVAYVDIGETDSSDDYKTRYADPRLEITGKTMEEAVLKLAEATFSIHGLAREEKTQDNPEN